MTTLKALKDFVCSVWSAEGNSSQLDIDVAVKAVAANHDMASAAIRWAVSDIARWVDRDVRGISLSNRRGSHSALVTSIVEHGLSLLDVKFGKKLLGDYLPYEAIDYAEQVKTSGRTMLVRASFVMGVASLCRDPNRPIRTQVSEGQLEELHHRLVNRMPDAKLAERSLLTV